MILVGLNMKKSIFYNIKLIDAPTLPSNILLH